MAIKTRRRKTFSDRCLEVSVETVFAIAFALAASFLINIHFLTAANMTEAIMFP